MIETCGVLFESPRCCIAIGRMARGIGLWVDALFPKEKHDAGTRNRVLAWMVVVGCACCTMGLGATRAMAGPAVAGVDLDADQRLLIEQLTADKAITMARERRLANADQEKLYDQLQVKDRALRAAQARAAGNAAELAKVRKARDAVASERQALIAALAQRDQTLAAEVRAYREVVTGIATSPDPRKQKALQRFADGEQREALDDLDMIADANQAATVKAGNIRSAAERRPIAELAVQAHDQGKVRLDEIVRRYEQLTQLDPGMTRDWIELARLYDEQGRLDDARKTTQSAYMSLAGGGDLRDRAVVLDQFGDVAVKAGDLQGAKARFEESLLIRGKLAKDHPASAEAQRDLSVSLNKLGDVAVKAGDLQGAKAHFEQSLLIARKLAKDHPASAEAQRDLSVSLNKLGDVAVKAGDLQGAKARFEDGLLIRGKLAKDTPASTEAQRDLSVSLAKLGDVAVLAGDLQGAKARFEESLLIARKLAKDNPTSAEAQRDLSISLARLGDIPAQAGDLQGAKARFEEGLLIARKLAKDNPASAEAQRDLSISLEKLGNVAGQAGDLQGAKARSEESLLIRRKLAKDNPASAEAQRDLSVSLAELGDVAVEGGELQSAKARFEEDLLITRKLAKDNPASAEAQRDLLVTLFKLGKLTSNRALLREALEIARALEQAGRMVPHDHDMLDVLTKTTDSLP